MSESNPDTRIEYMYEYDFLNSTGHQDKDTQGGFRNRVSFRAGAYFSSWGSGLGLGLVLCDHTGDLGKIWTKSGPAVAAPAHLL